ncbi:MAG: glucose-1-phosphate adenylyltransferase subunit GlgD [Sarcina sp.]
MKNCIGIINLDENEEKISALAKKRPLASVPIAGRYRVIDFILSNMTNSGLESIAIFTKNKSRSLMDHLVNGRPWDLHRKKEGLKVFNFGDKEPSYDDVHCFLENLDFVKLSKKEYVLLAPSYMIANIDFTDFIKWHRKSKNDISILYKKVENAKQEFIGCDVLNLGENNRVESIGENIGSTNKINVSMEMFLMRTDLFIDIIYDCIKKGHNRKVKQYIKYNLDKFNTRAYEFEGYLKCINSLSSYYNMNQELLKPEITKELFYDNMPIYTKTKDESPTKYSEKSKVTNSIIANGCFIEGTVENSIISRRVYIGEGAVLKNCIILQNTKIGDNAKLEGVITEKGTTVKEDEEFIGNKDALVVIKPPRKI